MKKEDILALINSNPAFHLATVEDGEPRVRGMLLFRADGDGIVFHTGSMKDLNRQLRQNPKVELCFNDPKTFVQVRVRGEAEGVDDLEFKKEIVESPGREFLRPWIDEHGYELLAVFRVKNCKASTWTMQNNFAPKEFVEFA